MNPYIHECTSQCQMINLVLGGASLFLSFQHVCLDGQRLIL